MHSEVEPEAVGGAAGVRSHEEVQLGFRDPVHPSQVSRFESGVQLEPLGLCEKLLGGGGLGLQRLGRVHREVPHRGMVHADVYRLRLNSSLSYLRIHVIYAMVTNA